MGLTTSRHLPEAAQRVMMRSSRWRDRVVLNPRLEFSLAMNVLTGDNESDRRLICDNRQFTQAERRLLISGLANLNDRLVKGMLAGDCDGHDVPSADDVAELVADLLLRCTNKRGAVQLPAKIADALICAATELGHLQQVLPLVQRRKGAAAVVKWAAAGGNLLLEPGELHPLISVKRASRDLWAPLLDPAEVFAGLLRAELDALSCLPDAAERCERLEASAWLSIACGSRHLTRDQVLALTGLSEDMVTGSAPVTDDVVRQIKKGLGPYKLMAMVANPVVDIDVVRAVRAAARPSPERDFDEDDQPFEQLGETAGGRLDRFPVRVVQPYDEVEDPLALVELLRRVLPNDYDSRGRPCDAAVLVRNPHLSEEQMDRIRRRSVNGTWVQTARAALCEPVDHSEPLGPYVAAVWKAAGVDIPEALAHSGTASAQQPGLSSMLDKPCATLAYSGEAHMPDSDVLELVSQLGDDEAAWETFLHLAVDFPGTIRECVHATTLVLA